MGMFVTKDPKKGFGAALFSAQPIDELTEEQERKRKNGELPDAAILSSAETPGIKNGGSVSSASKRADGCCTKGHTKGRMV
jgi:hypothetical protein